MQALIFAILLFVAGLDGGINAASSYSPVPIAAAEIELFLTFEPSDTEQAVMTCDVAYFIGAYAYHLLQVEGVDAERYIDSSLSFSESGIAHDANQVLMFQRIVRDAGRSKHDSPDMFAMTVLRNCLEDYDVPPHMYTKVQYWNK